MEQISVKIGQSWLNMQAVPLAGSLFQAPWDPTNQGTRQKKFKCISLKKKNDSKECNTTIWSAEKENLVQTVVTIGWSRLSQQAVPLASNIF